MAQGLMRISAHSGGMTAALEWPQQKAAKITAEMMTRQFAIFCFAQSLFGAKSLLIIAAWGMIVTMIIRFGFVIGRHGRNRIVPPRGHDTQHERPRR